MRSTSGDDHPKKTVILYARVSTEEQACSGYSLAQQLEALRQYADREGYEILAEVADPGQSGVSLERPGMDRVRDLVAVGGVTVVLAQDRDRFAREPAYHYLLRREFEEHGCKIRALNDRGDDSPEGELTDGILDQLAKFERAKTAERTRRGKLRKAREGKLIANNTPNYGFRFNASRDGYEVDEDAMQVVRRIFHMVGTEGMSLYKVACTLRQERVPTPTGKGLWAGTFIRKIIQHDVYKPHTVREIAQVVQSEVAARLDSEKRYGLWWFNRHRVTSSQAKKVGPEGIEYRRKTRNTRKPESEWIAVPVPDAGIPLQLVEAARAAIKNASQVSRNGHRIWELSGGVGRCGLCGAPLATHAVTKPGKMGYFYYRCGKRARFGSDVCPLPSSYVAGQVEAQVWDFVRELLKDPERLRVGLEEHIRTQQEATRCGDPEKEMNAWLDKLSELDQERRGYQRLAARGHMTDKELDEAMRELEESRRTITSELEALEGRSRIFEDLERGRDAILESYARMVREELDALSAEDRNRIYKMLRLEVILHPDRPISITGAFATNPYVVNAGTAPSCYPP